MTDNPVREAKEFFLESIRHIDWYRGLPGEQYGTDVEMPAPGANEDSTCMIIALSDWANKYATTPGRMVSKYDIVHRYLEKAVAELFAYRNPASYPGDVPHFNDHKDTTLNDVIAVYDLAADMWLNDNHG